MQKAFLLKLKMGTAEGEKINHVEFLQFSSHDCTWYCLKEYKDFVKTGSTINLTGCHRYREKNEGKTEHEIKLPENWSLVQHYKKLHS